MNRCYHDSCSEQNSNFNHQPFDLRVLLQTLKRVRLPYHDHIELHCSLICTGIGIKVIEKQKTNLNPQPWVFMVPTLIVIQN
jgi:hypothetical protein